MVYIVHVTKRYPNGIIEDVTQCGGSLIRKNFVLTASHCVSDLIDKDFDPNDLRVYVGAHKIPNVYSSGYLKVTNIFDVGYSTNGTDLSLLKLEKPVDESSNASVICLNSKDEPFTSGTVSGWGYTVDSQNQTNLAESLLKLDLTYKKCDGKFKKSVTINGMKKVFIVDPNDPNIICTVGGQSSTCFGDSGGPLFKMKNNKYFLLGTVSSGSGSCGMSNVDMIFEKISFHYEWINKILNANGAVC